MKKIFLLGLSATLVFTACKSKSSSSKSTTQSAPAPKTTASSAPKTVNLEPNDAMLTAVKTRFAETTLEVLQKGKEIYNGPCTGCHGAKNIVKREEGEWATIMDDMAPKAKLSTKDREAVWAYIIGVKLSSK